MRTTVKLLLCYNEIGVASQISSIGGGPYINDYTYLPRYGQDVPSHIYKRDVEDKWHGEKGLYVSYEEMGIPKITPDSSGKVHGNSKQSTNEQHIYEIYEKATNDVVKTGLSGQPLNKVLIVKLSAPTFVRLF